jgi:two-component system sensor histidine kinase UhpB
MRGEAGRTLARRFMAEARRPDAGAWWLATGAVLLTLAFGVDLASRMGGLAQGSQLDGLAAPLYALVACGALVGLAVRRRQTGLVRDTEELRFRRIVDTVPAVMWVMDTAHRLIYLNAYARALLGIGPEDEIGSGWFDLLHADDRQRVAAQTLDHFSDPRPFEIEFRILAAGGAYRHVLARGHPFEDADGAFLGYVASGLDVTAHKRIEARLRENERFLAESQAVASVGSWVWTPDGEAPEWSDEMYRICGLDRSWDGPALNQFVDLVVHAEDREDFATGWQQVLADGQPRASQFRIVRPDGTVRHVRAQCEVIKDDADAIVRIVGTTQDVTELREVERALRENEERFALAARGANDGLWDWPDLRSSRLWLSPRYYELLGYAPDELEASVDRLFSLIDPADYGRVARAVDAHFKHNADYDVEYRLRTRSGAWRWFRARGAASRDADGHAVRMAGSLQDIHDRKLAELEIEQHQHQLRRLAAQAALVAEKERRRIGAELHDRTIQSLGLIKVKLGGLRRLLGDGAARAEYKTLAGIVETTIHDTRALLSEISPPVLTELGFEAAVDWLAERAEGQYGVRCSVTDDGTPRMLDEDAQLVLFQTVRELLVNVGKHAEASEARVNIAGGGGEVVVTVEDDGVGFDAAHVEHRGAADGGYGLFSIRERLSLLGGQVSVDSRPAAGTRIVVRMPVRH